MTTNWKHYFDHIFCLHYTLNVDRKQRIESELKRVGILDSGVFSWHMSVPSPYKEKMYAQLPVHRDYAKYFKMPGYADAMFNHYCIMKESIAFSYKRILVLENDIVLLKDISSLNSALQKFPSTSDIVLLDYFEHYKMTQHSEVGRYTQLTNDYGTYHAASMYSFNQKALQWYVSIIDGQKWYPIDEIWNLVDRSKLTISISEVPLGIQWPSQSAISGTSNALNIYKNMKLDFTLYNT